MFSVSPALYRRPEAKVNIASIPLLRITSPHHDKHNGRNMTFCSICWQYTVIPPMHVLRVRDNLHSGKGWLSRFPVRWPLCKRPPSQKERCITLFAPPAIRVLPQTSPLFLFLTPRESEGLESCCITNQVWWQNIWVSRPKRWRPGGSLFFFFSLPPLGRDSLKSPSMASQVLPSPPQTRHRSSLASELRMLSQPTCFEINKQD